MCERRAEAPGVQSRVIELASEGSQRAAGAGAFSCGRDMCERRAEAPVVQSQASGLASEGSQSAADTEASDCGRAAHPDQSGKLDQ
jgi:predicted transcriptional regulator